MEHTRSVIDSDKRFTIHPVTRQIKNESPGKTTLIQHDHNSERFTFELPRYIEGHDMAECNKIEVLYLNIENGKKAQASGVYTVEDLHISEDDESIVVCSWLISGNSTMLAGSLNFLLRYRCMDETMTLTQYAWHTATYEGIKVSTGIDADERFEEEYVDIIAQWKASVLQEFNAEIRTWEDASRAELDEDVSTWKNQTQSDLTTWKDKEITEIRRLFGDYTEYWQKQIETERARIDGFVKLQDGSTTGDAELIDARVGHNGTVYGSTGTAIRKQVDELWTGLDSCIKPLSLRPVRTYADTYVGADGALIEQTGATVIEYSITGGESYYFAKVTGGRDYVLFYDADFTLLCRLTDITGSFNSVGITPEDSCYMRVARNGDEATYSNVIVTETHYNAYGLSAGLVKDCVIVPEAQNADKLTDFPPVYMLSNLLNPNTIETGVYCSHLDGEKYTSASFFITEKIRVLGGQTLIFVDTNMQPIKARMVAAYDRSGAFVGGAEYVTEYKQADGARYIVVTLGSGTQEQTMIADSSVSEFLPYRDAGYLTPKIIENFHQTASLLGKNALAQEYSSFASGVRAELNDFPAYLKNGMTISFTGKFESFGYFKIGKGFNAYRGRWFYIDGSKVIHHRYETNDVIVESIPHNLTISDYISIVIDVNGNDCALFINTVSGTFTHVFEWEYEACGTIFAENGTDMTGCKLSATSQKFRCPLWAFGDSYFGANSQRVMGQLKNLGYIDNILVDGLAGQNSAGAYADLSKCLHFGTPKYLLWCLGMNDSAEMYATYLRNLEELCKSKDITLILTKIPNVPGMSKSEINASVTISKKRFIDFCGAVGADDSGKWYTGYLAADNVHPTELGAKALAMQMLVDVPEIMQY